jgi:chromosome segregation ATPase
MNELINHAIPGLIGALASGIPLYIKLRKANLVFKKSEIELNESKKINTEAEWKRILEYRDAELVQLRARDEAQEKQIRDLYEKHTQCETDKARNDEKIKANDEKIKSLEAKLEDKINQIKELETKLEAKFDKLELLLQGKQNAIPK